MTTPDDHLHRLSTAQRLAVAVLQGDLDAVGPLIDSLLESGAGDGPRLVPLKTLRVGDPDRLRAVFYVNNDTALAADDIEPFGRQRRQWLAGETTALLLTGIDRLEVYEVPEHVARLAEQKLRDERQALEERAQDSLTRRVQAINEHLAGWAFPAEPPEPGPIGPPPVDDLGPPPSVESDPDNWGDPSWPAPFSDDGPDQEDDR